MNVVSWHDVPIKKMKKKNKNKINIIGWKKATIVSKTLKDMFVRVVFD